MAVSAEPLRAFDLAVVGAGVAGLTAAKVAAQAGLSVMVIERMGAGGQVMTVEHVANFPAYPQGISGYDLGPLLQEAAEDAGAAFMLDQVESLHASEAGYTLRCTSESLAARAVIVACGSRRRALGVPGETELAGQGVSHCASCDGPLFQSDTVLVVGGGDSGLSEAIVLSRFASEVLVVFREAKPIAQSYLVDAVQQSPNIKLLNETELMAITGDTAGVTGVTLRHAHALTAVPVRGVFAYAGLQAETEFLAATLNLNPQGQITTDDQSGTSLPGVFAAGDVRSGTDWRLSSAAEDGETAARSAIAYLRATSPS